MTLLDKFAGNLREQRNRRKLKQDELAVKVGVSASYVSMLERGQRSPPLDMVEKCAKALNVSPLSLLA